MNKKEKLAFDSAFNKLNFKIIYVNPEKNANGVDMWVQRNDGKPLSVEIKNVRQQKSGCLQVDPVLKNRQNDDLIAIVFKSGYVLIEPMDHHLKSCSKKGTRQFTAMKG